jgi:hypothetical protein
MNDPHIVHLLVSGETGSGREAEPGSFFFGFWFEPTPTVYFTAENRYRKRAVLPQIAIRNRRFRQISGVSLSHFA